MKKHILIGMNWGKKFFYTLKINNYSFGNFTYFGFVSMVIFVC